jgi:4-amino-4-deoxy-L-arabinose transferase-like glycosyltransferase
MEIKKLNYKPYHKGLRWLGAVALLLLIYFPLFLHLTTLPIVMWDESLFALRALHLFEEGGYLYNFNFYPGLPEHQNTKLPFTTFFQVLGYKVFGVSELGLRLPMVILFLALTGYLFAYFKRYFNHWGPALLFILILIASPGFVQPHMLRTGDQDVPFAMYLLLATLFFFQYLHRQKAGFAWAFAVAFIAALMTKNLLAGIIGPGLLLYAVYQKKLKWVFSQTEWYGALLLIAGTYAGTLWYFEWQNPGFVQRMWDYELMGRYQETIEGHEGGFLYYLRELQTGLGLFFWLGAFSPLLIFSKAVSAQRQKLVTALLLSTLSAGFILSFSQTKTTWYAAPLYTGFALLGALKLWEIYLNIVKAKPAKWQLAFGLIALLAYAQAYYDTVSANYLPKPALKGEKYAVFLKRLKSSNSPHTQLTIADNNFGTCAYFYAHVYTHYQPGFDVNYQRKLQFEAGQKVMSCLNKVLDPIHLQYEYQVLEQYDGCKLLLITGVKEGA